MKPVLRAIAAAVPIHRLAPHSDRARITIGGAAMSTFVIAGLLCTAKVLSPIAFVCLAATSLALFAAASRGE